MKVKFAMWYGKDNSTIAFVVKNAHNGFLTPKSV